MRFFKREKKQYFHITFFSVDPLIPHYQNKKCAVCDVQQSTVAAEFQQIILAFFGNAARFILLIYLFIHLSFFYLFIQLFLA